MIEIAFIDRSLARGTSMDCIQQMCSLEDIEPGEEQIITNRSYLIRQDNPMVAVVEVQSSAENDVIIYTDGSVILHVLAHGLSLLKSEVM
uniref:Uncharacterized protein n=1 Tax=Arion vulgaris TaxID=1028688 RepID=A0A0B7AGM5_9EUPU